MWIKRTRGWEWPRVLFRDGRSVDNTYIVANFSWVMRLQDTEGNGCLPAYHQETLIPTALGSVTPTSPHFRFKVSQASSHDNAREHKD